MVVGCQPNAPAAFAPRKYSWYSFPLEAESTPGPQCDQKDFMSMKDPLTPAGIEPTTLRIVAQHLNHCATAVPLSLPYLRERINVTYSLGDWVSLIAGMDLSDEQKISSPNGDGDSLLIGHLYKLFL